MPATSITKSRITRAPDSLPLHNRAYWAGEDYLGIGPSAFSTVGMQRWQNIANYREYAERIFPRPINDWIDRESNIDMKRAEKIALSLRTRDGVPGRLGSIICLTRPTNSSGLVCLQRSNGNFVLTRAGKLLADSVAEAFV